MSPVGEHGNDVRLLQRRRHSNLALEPLGADAGGELRREDFDDDLAAEADFVGDEDARHPAAAELALERVGSAQRRLELGLKVGHAAECTVRYGEGREIKSAIAASSPAGRDRLGFSQAAGSAVPGAPCSLHTTSE